MSIDPAYIKSAIETLELIQHLYNYLKENQKENELPNFLSQIESKGDARVRSSLGQTLGIDIPVADQEGKPTKYWEGVRDMAKLAHKQWLANQDPNQFMQFLSKTKGNLSTRIAPEEKPISPLEEMLQTGVPPREEAQPSSPLEDILVEPAPVPKPTPVPEPTPVAEPAPVPRPTPVPETTPVPEPTPVAEPVPAPKPIPIPEPTPVAEPVPAPKPIPIPEPLSPQISPDTMTNLTKPISPVTTSDTPKITPEPSTPAVPPTPDKFQALDEALKTSGLAQPTEEVSEPSPSLTSMLLQKDETGEKEEDDMLSLSLREALKILRDEDED
ncbi:MAG: hypothetical protein ACXADY_08740 [Candidatus Hodarchaeales archaeon]|jgi:hypothetical protein